MRPWKALVALAALVVAFFTGRAAVEQFESFQEFGHTYITSFHGFNIVVLVLATVALIELAILAICTDESEEIPIPFSDFVGSVLFGTAGVVAIGIGWYESKVMEGNAPPLHRGTGYNKGDVFAVLVVGIILLAIAVYYLIRDIDGYENDYEEPEDRLCGCSACAAFRRLNAPIAAHPPFGYGSFGYPQYYPYPVGVPYGYFFGGVPVDRPDITVIFFRPEVLESDNEDDEDLVHAGYLILVDGEVVDYEFIVGRPEEFEPEKVDDPDAPKADESSASDESEQQD